MNLETHTNIESKPDHEILTIDSVINLIKLNNFLSSKSNITNINRFTNMKQNEKIIFVNEDCDESIGYSIIFVTNYGKIMLLKQMYGNKSAETTEYTCWLSSDYIEIINIVYKKYPDTSTNSYLYDNICELLEYFQTKQIC